MDSLIWFCWLLLATPTNSGSYCPNGQPSAAKEFRESAFVFVGTVIAEREEPAERKSNGFYDGLTYTMRIDELLRGPARKTVDLFSENSTARYPMRVGERYLAFVYIEGGRYAVDSCGNSEPFTPKSQRLATVRRLARKRPPHE